MLMQKEIRVTYKEVFENFKEIHREIGVDESNGVFAYGSCFAWTMGCEHENRSTRHEQLVTRLMFRT